MKLFIPILSLLLVGCVSTPKYYDSFSEKYAGKNSTDCGEINMYESPSGKFLGKKSENRKVVSCALNQIKMKRSFTISEKWSDFVDSSSEKTAYYQSSGNIIYVLSHEENDSGPQLFVGNCKSLQLAIDHGLNPKSCEFNEDLFSEYTHREGNKN